MLVIVLSLDRWAPTSANKKVAGFGRLRRPSTQPAFLLPEPGNQISVGNVAEPGNRKFEAVSATSEALSENPPGWFPGSFACVIKGRGARF